MWKITNISDNIDEGYFHHKRDIHFVMALKGISLAETLHITLTTKDEKPYPAVVVEPLPEEPQFVMKHTVFTLKKDQTAIIPDDIYRRHKDRFEKYQAYKIIKIEELRALAPDPQTGERHVESGQSSCPAYDKCHQQQGDDEP